MKKWAAELAAHGLPMGSLPCKLGCPLLPYTETVGSPLLPNMKKWAAQWAVEWAAHGNFAMQIRMPTTSILLVIRFMADLLRKYRGSVVIMVG